MVKEQNVTSKVDLEAAKNWEYLKTQLYAYNTLIEQIYKTDMALNGRGNIKNELAEHISKLKMFYNTVCGLFDTWLDEQKEKDVKPDDYKNLGLSRISEENVIQLIKVQKLTHKINYWAQTEGPFATVNPKGDARKSWA